MSPARKVREIGDKPLTQFSNQEIKFKVKKKKSNLLNFLH